MRTSPGQGDVFGWTVLLITHSLVDVDMTNSVFDSIQCGPFKSDYHRTAVGQDFRSALSKYLERELLTQVTVGTACFKGSLVASYDEDRYCGPRSLVRDIYKLSVEFGSGQRKESLRKEIVYDANKNSFKPRREKKLLLWTLARQAQARAIEDLVKRVDAEQLPSANCPVCDTNLLITNEPAIFAVTCPTGCFQHDYHRDPKSGDFLHGHLFVREPE